MVEAACLRNSASITRKKVRRALCSRTGSMARVTVSRLSGRPRNAQTTCLGDPCFVTVPYFCLQETFQQPDSGQGNRDQQGGDAFLQEVAIRDGVTRSASDAGGDHIG